MTEGNPWIPRNPRRSAAPKTNDDNDDAVLPIDYNNNNNSSQNNSDDGSKSNNEIPPPSLNPFLGWTKLSACQVRRPRRKRRRIQNANNNDDEPLLRVSGKAIFFLHDPRAADNNNKDEEEEEDNDGDDTNKPWFQGRFFPSFGLSSNNDSNDGSRVSPTSVVSGQQQLLSTSSSSSSSWGLLAVQNAIEDECLLDDCGGYRELDLTIIRNKPTNPYRLSRPSSSSSSTNTKNNTKIRWVIENVEWTGGDMMRLSTDPYSLSSSAASSLSMDENGVKFEPETLMEGDKAMGVASKYFPSLVKRLQIHKLTNEEGTEEEEAMVIVGDMSIVAPKSFLFPGFHFGTASDDDGLWNDE